MASAMDGDTVNKTEKEERGDKNGGIFAKVLRILTVPLNYCKNLRNLF